MAESVVAPGLRRPSIFLRSPSLTVGLVIVALVLVMAFFPARLASCDPNAQNADAMLQAPSAQHWFGTDNFGRDMFSRVVWGTRVDLQLGFVAMIVPFFVGSLIGLLAGYYGGWLDSLLMRVLDIFLAFPFTLVVIVVVTVLGPGSGNLYMAMWLVGWPS